MEVEPISEARIILLAYLLATLIAGILIHVAMSFLAPRGGGTMVALGSGIILFLIWLAVAFFAAIAFPVAAALTWPFRRLAFDRPLLSYGIAILVGMTVGLGFLWQDVRGGPGDFFSAPIAGVTFAVVWVACVRRFAMANG